MWYPWSDISVNVEPYTSICLKYLYLQMATFSLANLIWTLRCILMHFKEVKSKENVPFTNSLELG
jgi:hypothetical protein